jgi:hypothetical protein
MNKLVNPNDYDKEEVLRALSYPIFSDIDEKELTSSRKERFHLSDL